MVNQAIGDLNSGVQNVSRFLDALPPGAGDLRQQLGQLRPTIEKVNGEVKGGTQAFTQKNDWDRELQVKVALIEVGLAEIPVAVLGNKILTRAEKVKEGSEKL